MRRFVEVHLQERLWIKNASVPLCCIPSGLSLPSSSIDSLVLVDIEVQDGCVTSVQAARGSTDELCIDAGIVDLRNGMVLPTFVDLHTHIGN